MVQCLHCGWRGDFDEVINGSTCPNCLKNIYNGNTLSITKIIDRIG